MATRARSILLLMAASLVAQLAVAACVAKKKTFPLAALDLKVVYGNGDENSTCGQPGSWLLRLDTSTAGAAAEPGTWEYTFLFDGPREKLYGCGGLDQVCPTGTTLAKKIESLSRVMIEGLSVTPSQYAAASDGGINVLCRGIADKLVVPSDVESTPTTPTATLHATVRVLKVGGSNRLPIGQGDGPPQVRFAAAASFSSREHGIGLGSAVEDPRGRVALAGGIDTEGTFPTEIWEFSPQTLELTPSGSHLSTETGLPPPPEAGAAALTATLYDAPNALGPTVLFAGGVRGGGIEQDTVVQLDAATLYRADGSVTPRNLIGGGRGFHTASYLDLPDWGRYVALVGGMAIDPFDTSGADTFFSSTARGDIELFFPDAVPLSDSLTCSDGPESFCTLGNISFSGRGGHGAVVATTSTDGRPRIYFGGGVVEDNANNPVPSNRYFRLSIFPVATTSETYGRWVWRPMMVVLRSSGIPDLDGHAMVLGGEKSVAGAEGTNRTHVYVAGKGFFGQDPEPDESYELMGGFPTLLLERGIGQAVVLRDRTVLVTGGRDDSYAGGTRVVERYIPDAPEVESDPIGRFELLENLHGDAGCEDDSTGALVNCVMLEGARYGHTALALEETHTWLDGAVFIYGGSDSPDDPAAELFVPAYVCDQDNHLAPVGPAPLYLSVEPPSNTTLPVLCDLDRRNEPVTNPLTAGDASEPSPEGT